MGIANAFNRIIRRELRQHAAWLPITNTFALGDFGVVSNGLFTRIGNVADLGISWKERSGPPSKLDYSSQSVTTTRIEGGANVPAFSSSTTVDAKLVFNFQRESTFVLKAAQIVSQEIEDIFAVATALHRHRDWRKRYRFVTRLYTAQSPLFLAGRDSATEVTLAGKAAALGQAELGQLSAGVSVTASRELSLEITGQTGVIGLGLGRVALGGAIKPLSQDGQSAEVGVEEDTDWDDDPKDDV
jgi:hypothetical protein